MKINNVNKIYRAIGLMSGTSLDGVDVALIETDGQSYVAAEGFHYMPYDEELRARVRACFGARERTGDIDAVEHDLTIAHVDAVKEFLLREGLDKTDIDVIGFHGQTITHDPAHKFTWQIGDGALLSEITGCHVVYDFRSADVAAGGQGAPLIPVYHAARARASNLALPVAIVNIGGVSNITWIGAGENNILAFDCGPGNAPIDDVVLRVTGEKCDWDGVLAKSGQVQTDMVARWMANAYFATRPPKSLDRDAWDLRSVSNYPLADAVATLTAFTVAAIGAARDHCPQTPRAWYVTGGGRLNPAIMNGLRTLFGCKVEAVDTLGWNGDALEAEGFAYMAVRSMLGLPISFPKTTGVPVPMTGGHLVPKV